MYEFCNDVTILSDVARANDVQFLASASGHVRCGTIFAFYNLKFETLDSGLKNTVCFFSIIGLSISIVLLSTQFEHLKDRNKEGVLINLVLGGDHVPNIEKCHRILKKGLDVIT